MLSVPRKMKFSVILIMLCLSNPLVNAQIAASPDRYPIIPFPAHLVPADGNFIIHADTKIVATDPLFTEDALQLQQLVKEVNGISLSFGKNAGGHCIVLRADKTIPSKEAYHLLITPQQIVLSAASAAGIYWGIETIRQLLPVPGVKDRTALSLPAADITDAPAFSWRGMHLDVARHFFSVAYLKKFIDRMALYKLNRLHLHLTDDEGWRIEIKKYPRLTTEGAWRTFDKHDSDCIELSKGNPDFELDKEHIIHRDGKTLYGGFYTQAQMKSVIAYAAARHVEIIPELDMPGHMKAAISLYPYLSCTGASGNGKGFSVPLCPCNESTFQFAENVYREIMALFPSKYVHIGGDEVEKSTWAQSPACKQLMEKEGIKEVKQLESYFIQRMEKFFAAHGKQLVGWDEILEGGIDSTATIMYWRSWVPDAPLKAARNGNDVIMAPVNPLYFDAWPDKSTLYNVYHFNPVPATLSGTEKDKIIGAQAELWSERIPSEKRADYMTMPRMTAMAELLWTDHPADYPSYLERLRHHYPRWDQMHIHYRLPDLEGFTENNVFTDSTKLIVQNPSPDLSIRYTVDGAIPDTRAALLPPALTISHSSTIRLAAFTAEGNRGDIYTLKYEQEAYSPSVNANADLGSGLQCTYYAGSFDGTQKMTGASPTHIYNTSDISVPDDIKSPSFGLQYRGYIDIPETGIYSFYLTSDDGSLLHIDNKTVVNNDGLHGAQEKSGQMALQKGLHVFALDFIEGGGGYTLRLEYGKQGEQPQIIPANVFKRPMP